MYNLTQQPDIHRYLSRSGGLLRCNFLSQYFIAVIEMYDSGRMSSLTIKSSVSTLSEKVESPKITGTKILVDGDS